MLPFFDYYLHVKNLRDKLISSRDIDGKEYSSLIGESV